MAAISQPIFSYAFLWQKISSYGPNWQKPSTGFDNGLAPSRRQGKFWINADPINWRIYAELGGR